MAMARAPCARCGSFMPRSRTLASRSGPVALPMIKLLGILLIAAGFALRVNALAVVTIAGIVTAWLAGFPAREIVRMLGQYFIDNRALTLPVILLVPAIGLLERHGLQQYVASLMR